MNRSLPLHGCKRRAIYSGTVRLGVRLVGKAAESSRPRYGPAAAPRFTSELAGRSFAQLTVVPLLLVIGWLLPGIPLLIAGRFLPIPMVLIAAPLAAILMVATFRRVPSRWPGPIQQTQEAGQAGDPERRPVRAWAATVPRNWRMRL